MINHFRKFNNKSIKYLSVFTLFFFAFFINQFYGNQGLFPHDSASHFDSAFRILEGQHPVKDFWIISGFIIDYLQSFLFLIFGTSWQVYVAHASLFNGLLTIFLLFFFQAIGLSFFYSLIICFSFSILAYPSSGTPFVDHHSSFFSLIAFICLILAIRGEKNFFWVLIPIFLTLAILSKAVPAIYFIITFLIILGVHISIQKNFTAIKYLLLGILTSLGSLFLILILNKINIYELIVQNFIYPSTIGSQRYENFLNADLIKIIFQYKFIFLFDVILLFLLFLERNNKKKNYSIEEISIFILSTLIFIFHQALTKNQIFINFLIPLQIGYILLFLKNKKILTYLLIFTLLVLTYKYHVRFNHERKFHELRNVNLEKAIPAEKINEKLKGLKWITPQFPTDPSKEIENIIEIRNILEKEDNFILMSNYTFFSTILGKKTNLPTRWFTFDGTDFPRKNNKYKKRYISLFKKIIKENNIDKIFVIEPVTLKEVYDYVDKKCFKEVNLNNKMIKLEILDCGKI